MLPCNVINDLGSATAHMRNQRVDCLMMNKKEEEEDETISGLFSGIVCF